MPYIRHDENNNRVSPQPGISTSTEKNEGWSNVVYYDFNADYVARTYNSAAGSGARTPGTYQRHDANNNPVGVGTYQRYDSSNNAITVAFLEYTTASVSSFRIKAINSVNYNVDWGDGSTETGITALQKDHSYSSAGVYTIKITPNSGSTFRPEHYGATNFGTNLTRVAGDGGSQLGTDITKWLRETTSLTSLGVVDTSGVTSFQAAWRGCTGLTSFPILDTSKVTNFESTWRECTGLTSFPALSTSSVTNIRNAWVNCTSLTEFPLIDTSSVTNPRDAWNGCTALTSFPSLDLSSGTDFQGAWLNCNSLTSFPSITPTSGTDFGGAWRNCTSLTDYPANQFDNTGTLTSTAFNLAFTNCALTAQSIENILTSLDTNGSSNITLTIGGGTNAAKSTWSSAATTAYNNLVGKGWNISYNS